MPTPKGRKLRPEHVRKLVEARLASPAWWEGRRRAAEKLRGRKPPPEEVAASLASRELRRRYGLTKDEAPHLWEELFRFHLERRRDEARL